MGAESKLKSGAAGDKQGKPPLRIPERQRQPATSRASPPTGTANARRAGDKEGKPPPGAWFATLFRCPQGKVCPSAALAIPAPGERTISNAAVACDG